MAAEPLKPHRRTLPDLRAKSRPRTDPERLTTHSRTVRDTVGQIEARIASPGILATTPELWEWVRAAGLLHDSGKIAEGFQQQLLPNGDRWGERHEVLSLAYVDLLAPAAAWSEEARRMIGTLVVTHHRALFPDGDGGKTSLAEQYNPDTDWEKAFTRRPYRGSEQIQVVRGMHLELLSWLAGALDTDPPTTVDGPTMAARARRLFEELLSLWRRPVSPQEGLRAVLAQGALTLADHAGSAHVELQAHLPLPADYFARLRHAPYPHQRQAAETDGHMALIAPTGSGKTEGGLAWCARQLPTMPGQPRVVWTLPYRASLHAARARLETDLQPAPGQTRPDIGLLHGTVAHALLTQALDDECHTDTLSESRTPTLAMARQARARASAMRLFTQRLRVATPHQLLSGAIAGPSHSSVLLEQANSLFVMDELHAYDPETFGRLCATMSLWEDLGSRAAILSATLAPPMIDILDESLAQPLTCRRAPNGTSPDRHLLTLDETSLNTPESRERLRAWLQEGYSVLAVANTVATAQALFEQLAPDAHHVRPHETDAAILLHSRFKNQDRDAIERRLLQRHSERAGQEPAQRGGLVVATQSVEVSLQLDFDRGAVEAAPIEAVAQRAGRINRRGRHPEGPVEFRVHRPAHHLPYEEAAVEAAWTALTTLHEAGTHTLCEQDIDQLLDLAYDTDWGREWAHRARKARDSFADYFLTFTEPFRDRTDFADELSKDFDSTEILHYDDVETYRELITGKDTDPLLATGLLIPVRHRQRWALEKAGHGSFDPTLRIFVTTAPYTKTNGLQLSSADRTPQAPAMETIL